MTGTLPDSIVDRLMHPVHLHNLLVTLILAATGCQPASAPRTRETTAPRQEPKPDPRRQTSLLQRQDTPPRGVPRTLVLLGFLGSRIMGVCSFGRVCRGGRCRTIRPFVTLESAVKRPHTPSLCLGHLDRSKPAVIEIRAPDGTTVRHTVRPRAGYGAPWLIPRLPRGPAGTYTINSIQGINRQGTTVKVTLPSSARQTCRPRRARPGMVITIALAGYPPRRALALHLYRKLSKKKERHVYITSLKLRTDSHGQAHRIIKTRRGDPETSYSFQVRPGHGSGEFTLTSKPDE